MIGTGQGSLEEGDSCIARNGRMITRVGRVIGQSGRGICPHGYRNGHRSDTERNMSAWLGRVTGQTQRGVCPHGWEGSQVTHREEYVRMAIYLTFYDMLLSTEH